MRRRGWIALLAAAAFAAPAWAQPAETQLVDAPRIALALTEERIEVVSTFAGARIVVYGVVTDLGPDDDIVVVLRGPDRPIGVTRKERQAGLWLNGPAAWFERAPSYYAAASTRPLAEIAPPDNLRRLGIGAEHVALKTVGQTAAVASANIAEFRRALIRLKTRAGLYRNESDGVEVLKEGLFRASVTLPPDTPTGGFTAQAYVFRAGKAAARDGAELRVETAGIERLTYDLAHDRPILYGLFGVILAVAAGWGAAAAFRRF